MAVQLTQYVSSCGGCAAKWDGEGLRGLLDTLASRPGNDQLLVGLAPFDDASVLSWRGGDAMVSTVDFFPAVVDDPDDFGTVSAANACSDVFAMGGEVLIGLAIAAFPAEIPDSAITTTMLAAARTLEEAGGVLAGGHTIRSSEPIFGLAVHGRVHPDAVWRKGGAKPGYAVVLSKPIGTGLVLNGLDASQRGEAIAGMRVTNRQATERLKALTPAPAAVTDVTGFGLLGHTWEIAERSAVRIVLDGTRIPVYAGAREAAEQGMRTSGDARNRRYLDGHCQIHTDEETAVLAFDPQTSGGLLAAVTEDQAELLSHQGFTRIGHVEAGPESVVLTS